MRNPIIATGVFPARNYEARVQAWSTVFGTGPTYSSSGIERAADETDFAVDELRQELIRAGIEVETMAWSKPLFLLVEGQHAATRAAIRMFVPWAGSWLWKIGPSSLRSKYLPASSASQRRTQPRCGVAENTLS
jgi:hypothetical protein